MSIKRSPVGLSPRVRGNHAEELSRRETDGSIPARAGELPCASISPGIMGSIPARAGEPIPRWSRNGRLRVYPRACGGTCPACSRFNPVPGLSPRVRGNRGQVVPCARDQGSIPARAGEPLSRSRKSKTRRVYPRACGGTAARLGLVTASKGLSPRVRGNRWRRMTSPVRRGSIPARAGEPLVIKSLNFLEFFTMSKSTERFRSSRFSFCK